MSRIHRQPRVHIALTNERARMQSSVANETPAIQLSLRGRMTVSMSPII